MSKLKRNIIQFTYDIEEFIAEIKEEVNGKEYKEKIKEEILGSVIYV